MPRDSICKSDTLSPSSAAEEGLQALGAVLKHCSQCCCSAGAPGQARPAAERGTKQPSRATTAVWQQLCREHWASPSRTANCRVSPKWWCDGGHYDRLEYWRVGETFVTPDLKEFLSIVSCADELPQCMWLSAHSTPTFPSHSVQIN